MRDLRIDLLRLVGVGTIVLAHVSPPDLIFQLRNFGVVMMVVVSAIAFNITRRSNEGPLDYIWRRTKRLVFPTWIFLTVFFLFFLVIHPEKQSFSRSQVIDTFLLLEGIGYVWVIRVFLLVAIAAPFIYQMHTRIGSNRLYFGLLVAALAVYEACRRLVLPQIPASIYEPVVLTAFFIVPYSLVFALGLRVPTLGQRERAGVAVVAFAAFAVIGAALWVREGAFVQTQEYKYPPSTYYLAYALFIAMVIWESSNVMLGQLARSQGLEKIVFFIARNSLWIYLWHILMLFLAPDWGWAAVYVFVLSGAVLLTSVQVWFVREVCLRRVSDLRLQSNLRMVLTG
jgi:peptidoglycan/LPS O-acetylase OafA/YrhL